MSQAPAAASGPAIGVAFDPTDEQEGRRPERAEADDEDVIAVVADDSSDPVVDALPPVAQLVSGANELGFNLLALQTRSGNRALSPTSIEFALALTVGGATGETRDQILAVLGVRDLSDLDAGVDALLPTIDAAGSGTLNLANRVFADTKVRVLSAFSKRAQSTYGADVQGLDFHGDHETQRGRINKWVLEHTGRKIPELIPKGGIGRATRIVLVNAMYFHDTWKTRFKTRDTKARPFTLVSGKKPRVPTMYRKPSKTGIAHVEGVQLVELAYDDPRFVMRIAMPDEEQDFRSWADSLDAERWAGWRDKISHRGAELYLPKFGVKAGSSFELSSSLSKLGMPLACDDTFAEFPNISHDELLFIDKVFHSVYVKVDEKGTEAAAATAVLTSELISPFNSSQPPIVHIDRPFVFTIELADTGLILFLGRIEDPRI